MEGLHVSWSHSDLDVKGVAEIELGQGGMMMRMRQRAGRQMIIGIALYSGQPSAFQGYLPEMTVVLWPQGAKDVLIVD